MSTEAAKILGCDRATVNRMAADGRLPIVRKLPGLRGPNLFERVDVERLAAEQAKETSA